MSSVYSSQQLTVREEYISEVRSENDANQVLRKYTNIFREKTMEEAYQRHCQRMNYRNARKIVVLVIICHAFMNITFAICEKTSRSGALDLLTRRYSEIGEWIQWSHFIIGIPFLFFPPKKMKLQWKWCMTIFSILIVTGCQTWLAYQIEISNAYFHSNTVQGLQCPENTTNETIDFLMLRDDKLSSTIVGVLSTLLTLIGCSGAASLRVDFVHIVFMLCCTSLSLIISMTAYGMNQQAPLLIITYFFPGTLLVISCYHSDRTYRLSFATKDLVEKENAELEKDLMKKEAFLYNSEAKRSEKEAVVLGIDQNVHAWTGDLLQSMSIDFAELKLEKIIGRGGHGEIILSEYCGKMVVCKRLLRKNINVVNIFSFKTEIVLLSSLRHPNITQLIGASWDNASNVCMVMEYMPHGDLHAVLQSSLATSFTWSDPLLKIAMDVCQGMLYLHSQNPSIVHRDIKSNNLLCSATFGCKISDFGLATSCISGNLSSVVGTPNWLAPEVIRNEPYGVEVDIFSFGIVLTELETRMIPYHDHEEQGLLLLMRVSKEGLRPTLPDSCLPQRRRLIQDCLSDDPNSRPSLTDILQRLQGPIRSELSLDTVNDKSCVRLAPPRRSVY